ncbi:unnamed protein product [Meganyctiphanes norvegica]|uniref:Uncharacterized protein n=1 Tax=Meganyctiphanes norvegica TaxID=48144 RepID=A0AAV2QNZ4_MEGNR
MHYAVWWNQPRCVEQLAKLGAYIDARDLKQITPIMLAVRENMTECVKALVAVGSDVLATDDKGRTPLDIARFEGRRRVGIWLQDHIKKISQKGSKGPVHVFNYVDFPDPRNKRHGSESDSKNIMDTFKNLNHDVHIHTNCTLIETQAKFEELKKNWTLNALIIIILSHGTDRYSFQTSDGSIMDLHKLRQMFGDKACPSLKGKPKIFLANFCRGTFPEYVQDAPSYPGATLISTKPKYEVPHNLVTIHASTEGIKAVRHVHHGSIFIICLCKILKENPKWELKIIFNELHRLMKEIHGTTPMWEGFPPTEDFYF